MARQKQYFPTLDGWRGLSVIGVILYHGRFGFFRSDSLLTRLSSHGEIGVDIFFAISGFLICRLLLNEYEQDGGINLRRFYIRRCFRILPPYYAAVAGIAALSVFGAIHVNYSDLPSCFLFYRNYRLLGVDARRRLLHCTLLVACHGGTFLPRLAHTAHCGKTEAFGTSRFSSCHGCRRLARV